MKIQKYHLVNLILIFSFLMIFFFQTIPIPVENMEGAKNPDEFIFGGFYWTSVLYELNVGNYFGSVSFALAFILLYFENRFFLKREVEDGQV